jgi:molybdenum cofactor cytidylyltransferase
MIILGDQPGITPALIDRVAAEWRQNSGDITLCSYQGRRGHPLLFARSFFDRLAGLHGDKAAWKLIDAHPALVHEVSFDLPYPRDINTQDDVAQAATTNKDSRPT